MNIDFPYHIAVDGRTAATGTDDHIRGMIEQVLFTNPGERVNRPSFGCGLLQLIFSPNSPELATATQSYSRFPAKWLGELIQLDSVDVQSEDSTLRVTIAYTVRQTQQKEKAEFVRSV
jgi:phage baseplate assembly protein W